VNTPVQKAHEINKDPLIYGTIAEIGAGQGVAGFFFAAGGASQSIAKTMSAYDMTFSDSIYGKEESGRYVSESRLDHMLDKEFSLLEKRLRSVRPEGTRFFAFANTVTTQPEGSKRLAHGWLGARFQVNPSAPSNDLIIHARLRDSDPKLQRDALATLGVNIIYAAFFKSNDDDNLLNTLLDNLSPERVDIDTVRLTGADFKRPLL